MSFHQFDLMSVLIKERKKSSTNIFHFAKFCPIKKFLYVSKENEQQYNIALSSFSSF